MRLQRKFVSIAVLLLSMMAAGATMAQPPHRVQPPDPLGLLKRALAEAGASALTSEQEAQLSALFTEFRNTMPTEPDSALEAAHTAYAAAILKGDLSAAKAQVAIITSRLAELGSARMQAVAKLQIDVLAVLKSGGQWDALIAKFGDEHSVGLLAPLMGGGTFEVRHEFGPAGIPAGKVWLRR